MTSVISAVLFPSLSYLHKALNYSSQQKEYTILILNIHLTDDRSGSGSSCI
jgi:hypothetical protein